MTIHTIARSPSSPPSAALLDSRTSWLIATISLICLGMSFGAPLIATVGLKSIAAEMGNTRSIPALAGSLAWFGSGVGGILMGRLAQRFGVRWTVMGGGVMVFIGLYISTLGQPWQLYVGHGVFIGFFGIAGLNAPLYIYVSNWFHRRRGSALALLSSGNYIAGFLWPVVFEHTIARWGWRNTMLVYGAIEIFVVLTLAALFLRTPPEAPPIVHKSGKASATVFGWPPNLVFALLAGASFLCCIPMAMPQGHLIALCTDHGISAAIGAAMLSILLGAAFFSRQAWGLVADRIGGLRTALVSSAMQAVAVAGYLYAQDEFGLFTVSVAFGIGFSALIPAYILATREIFPAKDAYWRVPTLLFMSGSGMATGGWLAGYMYDQFAYYGPAFATGVAFNVANLAILATLVIRQRMAQQRTAVAGLAA